MLVPAVRLQYALKPLRHTFSFSDIAAACATDLVALLLPSSSKLDPPRTSDPSNCRLDALQLTNGDECGCDCAIVRWLAPGRRGKAAQQV